MSSSFKGYWINGSKESGYTADLWKKVDAPSNIDKQPTLSAIKRAIITALGA